MAPLNRVALAAIVIVLAGALGLDGGRDVAAAGRDDVRILMGVPDTLDPAAQGDVGSAGYSAQLFETLTTFDAGLVLRPALARSWDVSADGRRVVFHLRAGLTFSDGTPLQAPDVVRSWLRLIDPQAPSPLASLISDVRGVADHLAGRDRDPASVGLRADGLDVVVELERPGADFPAIVAAPIFGVVPPGIEEAGALEPGGFVGSGGYVLAEIAPTELVLEANDRYWAGRPAIATVHALTDLGGRSPVVVFEDDIVDYTGISAFDGAWIRYDPTLGPALRLVPSLSLTYLAFDTMEPPFDDVRVRRAFGAAIDWEAVTSLRAGISNVPADSMVPPGIPGAPDGDWRPKHDPAAGRRLLAEAGYPGGAGFPDVVYAVGFSGAARGIAADLERELGIAISLESWDDHFGRLREDPPAMFDVGWVADYPGPNDFLGVLLRTGSTNDYGRWSSAEFDAAVDAALAVADPSAQLAAWREVLGIVRRDVPAVPLTYGDGYALSRDGLLGAGQNGLGFLRLAGLAWADG